jgi:hypothetical protein
MNQTSRQVAIADHLWETLARMSREMATPVDALLNQAIASFARANGYTVTPPKEQTSMPVGRDLTRPSPAADAATARGRPSKAAYAAAGRTEERTAPPPLARPKIAAEGGLGAGGIVRGPAAPPSSARHGPPPVLRPAAEPAGPARAAGRRLELIDDAGRCWLVDGDRFVIGRGRKCDLVIDSAKISREHAAIVRTADGWFVEDLGSSNGTWVDKQRIQRYALDDGAEFFVCTERLRVRMR